jgi:hypothetical protein
VQAMLGPDRIGLAIAHDAGSLPGERSMKHASNMLMVLLYAQGLLGFAGLTSVMVRDWSYSEPVFVRGVAPVDVAAR